MNQIVSVPAPGPTARLGDARRRASARGRGYARSIERDVGLLYLIGMTLPFPQVGVPLNESFTFSITALVGLLFAFRRIGRDGLTAAHKAGLLMLGVFAATAIARHPVASFALSLGALACAILPFASARLNAGELVALVKGVLVGLCLTLALMSLSIVTQALGATAILGPLAAWLIGDDQTGMFLGYIRPHAGFSEPSHLAIYLGVVYVVMDLQIRGGRRLLIWRSVAALAVVFTGSVSGLILLLSYVLARWAGALRELLVRRGSMKAVWRGVMATVAVGLLIVALGPDPADLVEEYGWRFVKTLDDIESGNIVGSEGSRVNAVLALPDYWDFAGLPGFWLGTGYANHQAWLIDTYGHLSESATFARGSVDSLLIAVFLATGFVGFVAYTVFLAIAFGTRVLAAQFSVLVFVLLLNFSYGYLIAGLYWHLLFLLAVTARLCSPVMYTRAPRPVRPRLPVRRVSETC